MIRKNACIRTERLCLQPFSGKDKENVLAILYNAEVKKTYMLPDFASREQAERMAERLRQLSMEDDRFVYGICLDDQLIGWINEVDKSDAGIELGYVIHPDHQNNGYATEALRAAIQELFRMGYAAVRAGIFEGNDASRRVIEKSGMQPIDLTEEIEYRGIVHHCLCFEIRREQPG